MNTWMNDMNMASILAEDVSAPELRNPLLMRMHDRKAGKGVRKWLDRLLGR